MALYAISDLHLALNGDKPMDVFGEKWYKHEEKIAENWREVIKETDTVLIAGDISWSIKMEEGMADLNYIHMLPGRKILVKGNHDYWWSSITKLNKLFEDMNFIQNNHFSYGEYAICGTRGWNIAEEEGADPQDKKVYLREQIRLRLSLESAVRAGFKKFIVMLHYPPILDNQEDNSITRIIEEYKVEKVIYGHLHGPSANKILKGMHHGVEYIMTSSDYLNFKPVRII